MQRAVSFLLSWPSSFYVPMKVIQHRLPDFDKLEILPLADLHLGDIHSDGKKINEWLAYIKDTPNCYTILNGDLMNTAIKTAVGTGVYMDSLNPMEQLAQCVKLFGQIAEAGKILAVTSGNHEARVFKNDGIDSTAMMCAQLKIEHLYSPTSALIFIQFGKQNGHKNHWPVLYSIYCVHGTGAGGRKEGGKINRLADLAEIVDADIFLMSHTHLPAIMRNSFHRVDRRHCTVQKVDRLFINTSSTLEYAGGYGELYSFKPNSLETPMIILSGRERKMQAIL